MQLLNRKLGAATKEFEDLSIAGSASDLKGKVVYEIDDPNRPRFSLPELRDILQVWENCVVSLFKPSVDLALHLSSVRNLVPQQLDLVAILGV